MRFYPRQLNGLKDLQLEKQRLKQAREELSLVNIITAEIDGLKEGVTGKGLGNTIISLLASESIIGFVIDTVPVIIRKFTRKKTEAEPPPVHEEGKSRTDRIFEIAELALGVTELFIRSREKKNKDS